jgi:hypothetical protein
MSIEGGCFCGQVRYQATEHTDSVAHCHCQHCRAATGGTFVTWVEVPRAALTWAAEPAAYRHESDWPTGITRRFCAQCGTSLTYERDGSDYLDIAAGSLDDPGALTPAHHVYEVSRVHWVELADDLPRYPKGRPDSR